MLNLLAENEQRLRQNLGLIRIADLPGCPYQSLEEVREAKASGRLILGAVLRPEVLGALGTRGEQITHAVYSLIPIALLIVFVVAAFWSKQYALLWGIPAMIAGIVISTPSLEKTATSMVGCALLLMLYLLFTSPVWAWVTAGFIAAYIMSAAIRIHFAMAMEERALSSEVFFCFLFLNRILILREGERTYHV